MRLIDVRKLAIRKQVRIRFPLANGMECVIDEHGLGRVSALGGRPDFDLEQELARAGRFTLEPLATQRRGGTGEGQVLTHQELQILAEGPAAAREGEE